MSGVVRGGASNMHPGKIWIEIQHAGDPYGDGMLLTPDEARQVISKLEDGLRKLEPTTLLGAKA